MSKHTDDHAVERFAIAMKAKLTDARAKGRGGWDDPSSCSVEHLAALLIGHISKGNPGNFEDIANLAMMLHQREADPAILAGKLPERTDVDPTRTGIVINVTETIRTAPSRIWLQVGDRGSDHDYPFPIWSHEVSWCADSMVACEVPYVRADLAGKPQDQHEQPPTMVPEGWQIVPIEFTDKMFEAAENAVSATGGLPEIWEAMLSAAPTLE
ncbi:MULTISPECIES: hypothetical protein [Aeromonas]|uniref:hypothetical protein n=1 Tax=Aeromonas TaxID=642 RepID=UPI000CB5437F|nr:MULTISPECIES: hypothetical protein [Aeromonas]EIS3740047.1 hypothetical protein [Aeromonas hydrophila]EIS3742226.1 hypothetical protein [Aeromonas hydrophila]MCP3286936.1 hypothetical protein [Aeromonas hydrophila]MDH1845373.1 hypothetical protein [Aeromonas caviae]PKD25344.1 hypothetical protein AO056_01402 [Aeromonas hydrophila]